MNTDVSTVEKNGDTVTVSRHKAGFAVSSRARPYGSLGAARNIILR
jgi:hypothetical protein